MIRNVMSRHISGFCTCVLLWTVTTLAFGSDNHHPNVIQAPHIQVSLIADKTSVAFGTDFNLGLLFEPDEHWHTYWRNPGDSGEAPTVNWQSSAALSFGEIQWPLPKAIAVAHLVNYGFESDNLLMVPVTLPTLSNGKQETPEFITVTADVSWLVCKEDCIPGWATLSLTLSIADTAVASNHIDLFDATAQQLPSSNRQSGRFEVTDTQLVFEMHGLKKSDWRLFPFRSDVVQHASDQTVLYDGENTRFVVPRSDYFDGQAKTLEWLISNGETGFYVNGELADNSPGSVNSTGASSVRSLWVYILMAIAGGIILNLMPCVLPILSIKALALQTAQQGHKWPYLLGVVFCFNLFAVLIVALQLSGQRIGWGFHMQEPIVVVVLAFLFTYIALILLDALAVSSRFANVGQQWVSGDSAISHFATGALAVIVASPCTAPFMAAALGVAMISEPMITFVLFNALAIGFALPLTLLFASPALIAFLPKPGLWMETFKRSLAFPMFATVAWLCWVFAGQTNAQYQFILLLCLIGFCLSTWLISVVNHRVAKLFWVLLLSLSILLPLSMAYTYQSQPNAKAASTEQQLAYSAATLQSLRNKNQVVVVNMTADWCITCKVNEQVALSSDTVQSALSQEGVQYMVGDWTNKNAEILEFLSQFDRVGVPLYVVYAGNHSQQVLPQLLTPNTVINAIAQAKEELNYVD